MRKLLSLCLVFSIHVFLASCSEDAAGTETKSEPETINTVKVELLAAGETEPIVVTYKKTSDPINPSLLGSDIPLLELKSNTTYTVNFSFIGSVEGETVVDADIENKKEDHIMCYILSPEGGVLDYDDADANDLPVGLTNILHTGEPNSQADWMVFLYHQPDSKNGNCGIGQTDFTFVQSIRIKDDVTSEEPEAINTVDLEIWWPGALDPIAIQYTDPDGDGEFENDFPLPELQLTAGATYEFRFDSFYWVNGSTHKWAFIQDKKEDHRLCFEITNDALINPTSFEHDFDSNNLPTGIYTSWKAGAAGKTGVITMTLRHQPGIKTGMCDVAGDVVDFVIQQPVKILAP